MAEDETPTPQDEPTADEATEAAAAPVEDAEAPVEAEAEEQPATETGSAPQPEAEAEAPEAPEALAAEAPQAEEADEDDDEEPAPRVKPAIPGADLEVDIVTEGDDPFGREDPYAEDGDVAIADAEEEQADQPIAEAAIDLGATARYTATGKRKTAKARVILKPGDGTYTINGKPLDVFFPRATLQRTIRQPLETVGYEDRMDVVARMDGGGVSAQAGALRHGISRALLEADPNLRGELKRRGFLTRDARAKERKKAGLKKARKRPQFSKR